MIAASTARWCAGSDAGGRDREEDLQHYPEPIELKDSEARGEIFEKGAADGQTYKVGRDRSAQLLHGHGSGPRKRPDYRSTTRDVSQICSTNSTTSEVDAVVHRPGRNGGGSLPKP